MSLAQKTILKASKLLDNDRLQKIPNESVYLVYGSNDDVYQVDFTDPKNVKCQCKGYHMMNKKDCYHCEAVRQKEEI